MREAPHLEDRLGMLLSAGMSISTGLLLLGLAARLGLGGTAGDALIAAGLYVLMATPVIRVLVSFVALVRARDWPLVAATLAVLATLGATLLVAVWEGWR